MSVRPCQYRVMVRDAWIIHGTSMLTPCSREIKFVWGIYCLIRGATGSVSKVKPHQIYFFWGVCILLKDCPLSCYESSDPPEKSKFGVALLTISFIK